MRNGLVDRRRFLGALLASAYVGAGEGSHAGTWEIEDLVIDADASLSRRYRLVIPRGTFDAPLPILVLLHGLGETKSERAGSDAWLGPYGGRQALTRLNAGVLSRVSSEDGKNVSAAELDALNRSLAEQPFRGLVLVCPYMPNPHRFPGGAAAMFRRYARFLGDALLPAVRAKVPSAHPNRDGTGIAGVSLGGYAALELGLELPRVFGTVGTVQGAFRPPRAVAYAERIAKLQPSGMAPSAVYVATTSYDPYRAGGERLGRELRARGVPTRLLVRRGPHSQGFLREIGTLDLLLWSDRALRGKIETGESQPV